MFSDFWQLSNLLYLAAQRIALPALGQGRRSRPARKMIRRRKLLGMCAESPASGARFVGRQLFTRFFANKKYIIAGANPQRHWLCLLTKAVP